MKRPTITLIRFVIASACLWLALGCPASEELSLKTEDGTLYGTLELPAVPKGCPVVLILPGSGPTDRDGNSTLLQGKNNSLRYLAEALAKKGIASLRIDKRGIGKSASALSSESDIRFEKYIEDARQWLELLKKDKRFSSHFILGHSEGALIGSVAAANSGVDGFVSIAGTSRPASELILDQLQGKVTPEQLEVSRKIISELNAGRVVDNPPPELAALFRPSVQPYLISWFRHDPKQAIAKIKGPVLVVQGGTDIQVQVSDAEELSKAAPGSRKVIIAGMNHILKDVPADPMQQMVSYSSPSLPVSPRLVEELSGFILNPGRRGEQTNGKPGLVDEE